MKAAKNRKRSISHRLHLDARLLGERVEVRQDAERTLCRGRPGDLDQFLVDSLPALAPLLRFMVKDEEGDADVDRVPIGGVPLTDPQPDTP
jgi:hypothetical protein